ncbi:MAG: chemotaxis protein CheW [Magnetospirillum sp.]|nr:chemotaxis protein CheW [Magnetospirillum sp.]
MTRWSGNRTLEVVTLALEGNIFALEASVVREILDLVPITQVPNARPFVGGLINVRGKVVPLVDLRVRLGMALKPPTIDTRIVVIELAGDGATLIVGLLADKVYEVTEVAAAALEETPRIGLGWPAEFIRCVGKRGDEVIVVLDIDRAITADPHAQPAAAA